MNYILDKSVVRPWLRKQIKQGILVAPVRLQGGDVAYKEVISTDDILLEYQKPLYSVKAFLLPQEETMMTFENRSASSIEETLDNFPRIFFGLRPCDLRAVLQADRFFAEGYRDPYYLSRRANTLLITVGCNEPEVDCFCHAIGLGPSYKEGADLYFTDLGAAFQVTPLTEKGNRAVTEYAYFFSQSSEEIKCQIVELEEKAKKKLLSFVPINDATKCYSFIDENYLNQISNRCASCGSCSYVCPMCFCYNVVDREDKELKGQRVRTWDSCIFEGFTRMAGRHNLIKNRQQRLKKRFDHKLAQYPEQYGIPGCTGCGRCTRTCLGHISMLDVIKEVTGEVD